jgi:hypothetical protein
VPNHRRPETDVELVPELADVVMPVKQDPLAVAFFRELSRCSLEDQMLAWQALAQHVEDGLSPRQQQARQAALACWYDLLSQDPSRSSIDNPLTEGDYKRWRESDESRKKSFPSVSALKTWAGRGWLAVLHVIGQKPLMCPRDGRPNTGASFAFSKEHLRAQLVTCRAALAEEGEPPLDWVGPHQLQAGLGRSLRSPRRSVDGCACARSRTRSARSLAHGPKRCGPRAEPNARGAAGVREREGDRAG